MCDCDDCAERTQRVVCLSRRPTREIRLDIDILSSDGLRDLMPSGLRGPFTVSVAQSGRMETEVTETPLESGAVELRDIRFGGNTPTPTALIHISAFTRGGALRRIGTAKLTLRVGRRHRRAALRVRPVPGLGTASARLHVEYTVRRAGAREHSHTAPGCTAHIYGYGTRCEPPAPRYAVTECVYDHDPCYGHGRREYLVSSCDCDDCAHGRPSPRVTFVEY